MNGPKEEDLILLAREALSRLEARQMTLAVAESITGGLIGHVLTETPGASRAFLGGVVAYDNRLKEQLGVPSETLDWHGAVSEETARAMAEGVRVWAGADVGLAVTGIAGPGGATETKPVGLTYVAITDEHGVVCEERRWGEGRSGNKRRAAEAALALLIERLSEASR